MSHVEETAARVAALETKIAALQAQRDAARRRAAEAAADGLDGTAQHHAAQELEAELAALRDGLALARERADEARIEAEEARRAEAKAEAEGHARAELAAWATVQGALMALNDAWLDAVDAADARAAALVRAGLKAPDAHRRRRTVEVVGCAWALSPTMAQWLRLDAPPQHLRQPLDAVMRKALGLEAEAVE